MLMPKTSTAKTAQSPFKGGLGGRTFQPEAAYGFGDWWGGFWAYQGRGDGAAVGDQRSALIWAQLDLGLP